MNAPTAGPGSQASSPEAYPTGDRTAIRLHVYRVTKYDPADRNEHGHYVGPEDVDSDHGPVEAAYLASVAAFAEETGITHLTIREPGVTGFVNFGVDPPIDGHGLAGLFPPDLTGYHDGAQVPMAVALELVRAMLRDNGAWCRLEVEDRFFVHIGYDQYAYVGSALPCPHAVALTHQRGLFAEPINQSPYDPQLDEDDSARRRPADDAFWAELDVLISKQGAVVLEEGYLSNASRWHRVTLDEVAPTRTRLTPRARLLIWPDLSTDLDTALAGLPDEGSVEIVWQHPRGHITSLTVDETEYPALPAMLAEARAVLILSGYADERTPLMAAVMPDPDGVLRARWMP
ncbi:RNA-binding protein [Nonomuraea basaltis]|uniref:RNA-binding protein n=1 Tax=Nonomuraea basaltis TaxID=2495887 RepID=UPI001F111227|nr:RNA-binding protein [Nonomuraea basaltis]